MHLLCILSEEVTVKSSMKEEVLISQMVLTVEFAARDSRFLFITVNLMFTKSLVS